MSTERSPLLEVNQPRRRQASNASHLSINQQDPPQAIEAQATESTGGVDTVKKVTCIWRIFYILCFLSGQYINFEILRLSSEASTWKKFISVAALLPFAVQIIVKFGYVGTALAVEYYTIGNISYTENLTENTSIVCMLPHEHWKFTTAITISTFAAFVSYSFITFCVLIPVNSIRCCRIRCSEGCCIENKRALKNSTLSPFDDDDELSTEQRRYFFISYAVMILLFISSFAFSIYYAASKYSIGYCSMNALYSTMIVLHLVSQFSAIHSCFIFSKIVYKVTNKLLSLDKEMDLVNSCEKNDESEMIKKLDLLLEQENDKEKKDELECIKKLLCTKIGDKNRGRYYWLKKINQSYVKQVNPVLKLFGYWFISHWTFFALTTMLLSGFIVQVIIEFVHHFKTVGSFLPDGEADIKVTFALYVIFFTLLHAYLFLYPCFRAAAIGTEHAKFVSAISKKQWTNIPVWVQTSFVQYLTTENFAFQVPLFCANIAFSFNWVYVSFFISILGAYMKF